MNRDCHISVAIRDVAMVHSTALGWRMRTIMQHGGDGGSVTLELTFWFENDGSIRIAIPGSPPPFVTIKDDPERPSGHPRLFQALAQLLQRQGVQAPHQIPLKEAAG